MIDWFVLLVPLAALPMVTIFGFVGCHGVDDYGPMLQLPEGLGQTSVDSIEVTITVTGENGKSSSDTQTRDKADLLAGKESFIEFFIILGDIDAEEEGSAHCHCSLFFADQGGADLKRDHDSPNEFFVLTFIPPGLTEGDFFLA